VVGSNWQRLTKSLAKPTNRGVVVSAQASARLLKPAPALPIVCSTCRIWVAISVLEKTRGGFDALCPVVSKFVFNQIAIEQEIAEAFISEQPVNYLIGGGRKGVDGNGATQP
jgi:hypothetical protein